MRKWSMEAYGVLQRLYKLGVVEKFGKPGWLPSTTTNE